MNPVKPKMKKSFSPSKKDIQAHGDEIQRREDAREPSDRDAEIDQMAKDYGYGKKEESKIAFRKDTIHGQAARKTAAETLKHHKAKQQAKPGAAPRAVAKEVKQFSKDTYKQRESTILKDRMVEILANKINEARGDAIQKLGIPLTHITGSDGPVVPPRGHRVAKRLADRAKERKARDKELASRPPTPNYVRPTRRSMGDNTYRGDSD